MAGVDGKMVSVVGKLKSNLKNLSNNEALGCVLCSRLIAVKLSRGWRADRGGKCGSDRRVVAHVTIRNTN